MLKILTKSDRFTLVYDQMLRGRARIFGERLNWDVRVCDGKEFDAFDEEDPVYLIALDHAGRVSGSLRLLPTTGPTMLKSAFGAMFQEPVDLESPTSWECTRFCVHPSRDVATPESKGIALQLLSGLCDLALDSGVATIVGVYEAPMERVYRRLGWAPSTLAAAMPQFGRVLCGLWNVEAETGNFLRKRVASRGLLPLDLGVAMWDQAFPPPSARWQMAAKPLIVDFDCNRDYNAE